MKLRATAGRVRGRCWPVCLATAASLATQVARADQWTLESSVQAGLEINDNVLLMSNPSGSTRTVSLTNRLSAARSVENAATKLDVTLSALDQRGGDASSRIDGRLGISHALTLPRGSLSLGATLAQDFNSDVLSADVTVGRGRRRTIGLSFGGSYALSERVNASVQGSLSRAGYGEQVTQAVDYRDDSAGASLSYALSEIESVSLQTSRTHYHTLSGGTRSIYDSLDLSYSRSLSERASASLSVGRYRDDTAQTLTGLACPLPATYCASGLVPYIVVQEVVHAPKHGIAVGASLSYSPGEASAFSVVLGRRKSAASFSMQFNERDSLTFSATRQISPSGTGTEVRSQEASITGAWGLAPTLNASMSLVSSRATVDEGTSGRREPLQTALSVTLSEEFTRDASLVVGWRRTEARDQADGGSARSNSVSVNLRLTWARLDAGR